MEHRGQYSDRTPLQTGSRTRVGVETPTSCGGTNVEFGSTVSVSRLVATVIKFERAACILCGRETGTPARDQLTKCKILF